MSDTQKYLPCCRGYRECDPRIGIARPKTPASGSRKPRRIAITTVLCTAIEFLRRSNNETSMFELEIAAWFLPMLEGLNGLAEEPRDILFGTARGRPFTGTYKKREGRDRMYDGMINACEKAIEAHGHQSKGLLYG